LIFSSGFCSQSREDQDYYAETHLRFAARDLLLPVTASSVTKQTAIVHLSDIAERRNHKKK